MNKLLLVLLSSLLIGQIFGQKLGDDNHPMLNDLKFMLIIVSTTVIFTEIVNCKYPYYDGEHENIGIFCQWEQEDFEYVDSVWKLKKEESDDNFFERRTRRKINKKN